MGTNFDCNSTSRLLAARKWLERPPVWVTLTICAAILILRRADAWRIPQFWAEDGTVFFLGAMTGGSKALLEPYAGYLHFVPRLVAWFAVLISPWEAPMIFMAGSSLLTLYVVARTQSSRCPFTPHSALGLAVVLVPDTFEVLFTLANLQWVLAAGLLLLLISRDAQRWWQLLHDCVAAVLIGLTGPFSIILAPLFLWRAWLRRSHASFLVLLAVGGTALCQAWIIKQNPMEMTRHPIAMEHVLAVPGFRVGGSLLAGAYPSPLQVPRAGPILGAITIVGLAWLSLRKGASRIERIWLGLAFLGLLVSALYRCRYVLPELRHSGYGSRYFIPLQIIAMWLLCTLMVDDRKWIARVGRALGFVVIFINLYRLREPALVDLNWPSYALKIRSGEEVTVPINPQPWAFTLPARQ